MGMFMGSYDHSLDAKGRVIIPSKFREALGEKFVITNSLDPCLCVYDMSAWERFVQKLTGLPYNTRKQRELVRFFMSNAVEVEPDKQGRILIPQHLSFIAEDLITVPISDEDCVVPLNLIWKTQNPKQSLQTFVQDFKIFYNTL